MTLDLLALAAGTVLLVLLAFGLGLARGRRDGGPHRTHADPAIAPPAALASPPPAAPAAPASTPADAECVQLRSLGEDRRALLRELGRVRGDLARYRQLVVDLENEAPPPILGERGTPDDLRLIVGVGPVLERMLQQLGVTTYRQIARWTERDIDAMDARLAEFPGRIRRDAWVAQARALHQSKYGEAA